MTFYELETNTLIARPLVPLREDDLCGCGDETSKGRGRSGGRVSLKFINHVSQNGALECPPAGTGIDSG